MADDVTDVVAGDAGDGSEDELSFAEATVAAMREAGILGEDDDEAGAAPEASDDAAAKAEPEKAPEAEKKPDEAEQYAAFGRSIAEGMERDPVGTLKRLQQIAAQANPSAVVKEPEAEPEAEDLLKGEEPLTEFERALWPHARALSQAPEKLAALEQQVGSVVGLGDTLAVTMRAMWELASSMLPEGVKLPSLDTTRILNEARGGAPFDQVFAKAWTEPLKAAMATAKQVAGARPGTPAARTGSRATTSSSFAEMYLSDDVDNDVATARARRREVMRPIPAPRPR